MTPAEETSVWLVLCSGPSRNTGAGHGKPGPVTSQLLDAFTSEFGQRATVVRSSGLVLGVEGGRLTLADTDGRPLSAPAVAYARLSTPRLSADREVTLLRHLAAMGTRLLNPAEAVLASVNKFWQLQQLAAAGIPVPDTRTHTDAPLEQVPAIGLPAPYVVKAVRGHRGRRVFLAPDDAWLRAVAGSLDDRHPYLLQRYVAHSHGRDLRVLVVDGRAVAAVVRTAHDDRLVSNLAQGGTHTVCTGRYPDAEALAVAAADTIGLGVAGVDLLFEADGSFSVCEVNGNPTWQPDMPGVAEAVAAACRSRLAAADPVRGEPPYAAGEATPGSPSAPSAGP
ncbi:RimK family alpha-L-glutamate ligase [Streptomyces sp. NPDC051921]|uniref:ATP-grasp domain-containing protein n=1 Tax=Streptomyces sp. NPDC051921 TaxID=3155806 RepID=UPI003445ED58